jgi:hypothetical protein
MTTFTRFIPDITNAPVIRKVALSAAGLAFVGGAVAGPMTAAHAAAPEGRPTAVVADRDGHRSAGRELQVRYEAQPNFYYCGPAAARNALSVTGKDVTQDDLAQKMGTTEAGTNSVEDVAKGLNAELGADRYHTTALSDPTVSAEQKATLRADVKAAIDEGRAVVANVVGTATDTDGGTHSFPGGHYISVVGYVDDGATVKISDSADPARSSYWISTDSLADWMATRGYTH